MEWERIICRCRYIIKIREQLGHELILIPSVAAVIKNGQGDILFQYPGGNTGVCQLERLNLGKLRRSSNSGSMGRNRIESTSKKKRGIWRERFRHIYPNGDQVEYIVVVFECEITSGKLKSIDGESLKLQYFSFSEKPTLALPYPDNIFL